MAPVGEEGGPGGRGAADQRIGPAGAAERGGGGSPREKALVLGRLPNECWLQIFANLEAAELSGIAAGLCAAARTLAGQPELWVALLHLDFCASLSQRAMLRAWLKLHKRYHPRQLYVFKRREHSLDLDMARAELQHRAEQVKEQDRKQRRLRALNVVLVRLTHLLLCAGVLASVVLLWMRLNGTLDCSYYVVFAPIFAFEVFLLATAVVAFTIYSLRGVGAWTFYWNRLRGAVRWLILYTSPCEGALLLLLACAVLPLLACSLEGDLPEVVTRRRLFRHAAPFAAFWVSALLFVGSLLRRRVFSASCLGSCLMVWLPLVSFSVLLFLKLSVFEHMPMYLVFAPTLGMTSLFIVFVGFLVIASFWLGYRGNRDWTEYATFTLLTLLTLLVPLLVLQLAVLARLCDKISTNMLFVPWTVWLSCLALCATCHVCTSLTGSAASGPGEHASRPWRHPDRDAGETELLLTPSVTGIV